MSYIGNEPIVSATRTITEATATAGQTVFTANGGYTVGYIDVFVNGAQLQASDFTATNGTSVTLNSACALNDDVRLVAWGTFQTSGALTSNNPSYTGTLTGGTGVVNLGSGQVYKDASGNVGIGTSGPSNLLHLYKSSGTPVIALQTGSSYGYLYNDGTYLGLASDQGSTGQKFRVSRTAPDNAATVDSSGNLLVGKTAADFAATGVEYLRSANILRSTASSGAAAQFNRNTSTGEVVGFFYSSTQVGNISVTGSATSYVTSSDYRLKENIAPMKGALAVIGQLKPVTYTWKADGSSGQGFIAHELQEVVPDCVTGEKDAVDAEENPVYQGIDTSFLVATLTAAIQEQQAIITELKTRIETLESK